MATVEERLKLKRVLIDTWSIKEQLCLASSVLKSGDQNWMSVSRSLKPFAEPSRPTDWYSQKSCAVQYSSLLDYVGTQKRKKRTDKGSEVPVETPGESIVKKLTQERIEELTSLLNKHRKQYLKIKEEIILLKSGQIDDRLDEYIQEIDQEKIQKEKDAQIHIQWLKEREEKKLELERAWKPPITAKPSPLRTKLQKNLHRRNSSQSEPSSEAESTIDSPQSEAMQVDTANTTNAEEIVAQKGTTTIVEPVKEEPPKPITGNLTPTSPLLTNLLKSPSPALSAQTSILHSAITSNKVQSQTNISMLLNSSSTPTLNSSPPTTVSSSLKNLVTNAIDSAEEASQKPHITHISPSAGAPTLSMLLELPPSVPGKPLPQLPQVAPITPQIEPKVEIKEEIKIKDNNTVEEVSIDIDDIKDNISIPSPESIPDTPKAEVVEIYLEEVIGNEENLLDSVSMEDIESVIKSVEQKEKLLAEAQSLQLSKEQLTSTKLPSLIETEKEKENNTITEIDKIDDTPSTPISNQKEKLNSEEIELEKNNVEKIKPNLIEEPEKKIEKLEESKYEEVEIVDTSKTDGDSNLGEESSPVLDEQSIAEMEVIILGKPENNSILKENKENDVTLILGDDKANSKENNEIKSENEEEPKVETEENTHSKSESETKVNSPDSEIKKEEQSDETISKKLEADTELENVSTLSPDNKDKDQEISTESQDIKDETEETIKIPDSESDNTVIDKENTEKVKEIESKEETKEKDSEENIPEINERISKTPETVENQVENQEKENTIESPSNQEIEIDKPFNEIPKEVLKELEPQDTETTTSKANNTTEESTKSFSIVNKTPIENAEISDKVEDQPNVSVETKPKSPAPTPTPTPTPAIPPQIVALRSETPSTEDDRTSDAPETTVTPYIGRSTRKRTRANTPVDSKPNSPAFGNNDDEKEYRVWKKSIMLLYSRLSAHKYASLFLKPITDDQAPGYSTFVHRPIDLPNIKKNIETGQTRTTAEFQRDVMLMFTNAIMYNNTKHHVHKMAKQMQSDSIQHIKDFLATQVLANTPGAADGLTGLPTTTPRRETRETNKQRDFAGLDEASSSSSGSGQGDAAALSTNNASATTTTTTTTTTLATGKRKRGSIVPSSENLDRSTKKRKC